MSSIWGQTYPRKNPFGLNHCLARSGVIWREEDCLIAGEEQVGGWDSRSVAWSFWLVSGS